MLSRYFFIHLAGKMIKALDDLLLYHIAKSLNQELKTDNEV